MYRVTRGGYEEPHDNSKTKDGKDLLICICCGGSGPPARQDDEKPASKRAGPEVIQCDHCELSWHLDCLDPPLAVAPQRSKANPSKPVWMCPRHVDPELNNIDPTVNILNKDRPEKSRKLKIRKPRNALVVDTALSRGVKNNGLIEIINEPSDDEANLSKPPNLFRAPERGFKLDFIDRVKR